MTVSRERLGLALLGVLIALVLIDVPWLGVDAWSFVAPKATTGGVLVTCSCSYNISEAMFGDILLQASVDSRVPMSIVEKRAQGRDHPVLVGVPETHYLKCFILRRVE